MEKGESEHIRVKKHICVEHEWCKDIFFLLLMYCFIFKQCLSKVIYDNQGRGTIKPLGFKH